MLEHEDMNIEQLDFYQLKFKFNRSEIPTI